MNGLGHLTESLQQFFSIGGLTLWGILLATIVLWTLIIERYVFLYTSYSGYVQELLATWQARTDRRSWYARQLRRMDIAEVSYQLRRSLPMIRALTASLPLLGLLGTVNGMIHTFTVMRLFGTGNANGLANGISEALVTTMAGLVCALPGLYFSTSLENRADVEVHKLTDLLTVE
jgi:biopolymer transport protein ExbB